MKKLWNHYWELRKLKNKKSHKNHLISMRKSLWYNYNILSFYKRIMGEVQGMNWDVKFYQISLKDTISIMRNEKQWDEYVKTPVNWIEGMFTKIETGSYKWLDGEDVPLIKIYLKDNDGEYLLSTAWTSVGRSIVNSLAGEEKLWKLTISVYGSPKDGKTRPSVSVRNNWEKTKWKYTIEEQKKHIEEIKDKKGTIIKRDYESLNNLLLDEFEAINKKFDWDALFDELTK